jgi:hypothetical protein
MFGINFYQTKRHHIAEDITFHNHCNEILKSNIKMTSLSA